MNIIENEKTILIHIIKGDKEGIITLDMGGNIIEEILIENKNILNYTIDEDDFIYMISNLKLDKIP